MTTNERAAALKAMMLFVVDDRYGMDSEESIEARKLFAAPVSERAADGRVIDKAMVKRLAIQHGLIPSSGGEPKAGEREAFEANERLRTGFGNDTLTPYDADPDQYFLPLVQARWEGWQARAAQQSDAGESKPIYEILSAPHTDSSTWEEVPHDFYRRAHPTQRRIVYTRPGAVPVAEDARDAKPVLPDTPYVLMDGITYVSKWSEEDQAYRVQRTPAQLAREFSDVARHAQTMSDVRSILAGFTDLNSRTPDRHVEAQRVLPLFDAFLGEGFTGRAVKLKRAVDAALAADQSGDAK